MARRGFQQGSLFKRGIRRKVWVGRWWEDVALGGGGVKRLRRSEVIGTVAELPTRREAMQAMAARLVNLNSGKARAQSVRTFTDFVSEDWSPVILPTLKYATQKHYNYMLDVHLIPAFGNRQLFRFDRFRRVFSEEIAADGRIDVEAVDRRVLRRFRMCDEALAAA